ncbi:uncharacterized protein [Littorina saxatilis]|uniref:Chitin-binding type-2 domain-containing protein n=1 Tax=Littorina saxatilis TaxID=31220 RepID=A0AAN9GBA3_9CAEN
MGLGKASLASATVLLVLVGLSEAMFYRTPNDGDACSTYRFTSDNPWVASLLAKMMGPMPCATGQVINAEGECVDREEVVADRCRDPFRFNQTVVNMVCFSKPTAKFADPLNCSWYYDCASSNNDKHVMCPTGMNYDDVNKTCRLSTQVRCGQRPVNYTRDEISAMCTQEPRRMIARTDNCNSYYDCAMTSDPSGRFLPFEGECDYLQLLDPETKECKPYPQVACDLRKEIKRRCDLKQSSCGRGHCRSCIVDHPDCTDQPNGHRPIPNQEFTPRYAHCLQGRTLEVGSCEPLANARGFQEQSLFDARKLECVPVSAVPRSLGGAGDEEEEEG